VKICVVGLGFIGLPLALLLSENNFVYGCDIDENKVNMIKEKKSPFKEPGLINLLQKSSLIVDKTPCKSEVFIVCVPTPFNNALKYSDMTFVKNAITSILPFLEKGNLIIIESTIAPATCKNLIIPLIENSGWKIGEDILLAHCPERAIPGKTISEMKNNARIIGGYNKKSAEYAKLVYSSFVKGELLLTDIETAEFIKLIENTYRDVNIALANELAILSEELGINVRKSIQLANLHPRVNILSPGPGVGGHCIAVDPWFLTESTLNSKLISSARSVNDNMPLYVFKKAKKIMTNCTEKPLRVSIFGVAYKGNIDDARETPALKLIKLCEKENWTVMIHDPYVTNFEYDLMSMEESVDQSDLVIIVTDHDKFKQIDPSIISTKMRNKNILDTRGILDVARFINNGLNVFTLGVN
jgi:UDP-N-acetyl-D-mannosaminuronic acid dehydrogenase